MPFTIGAPETANGPVRYDSNGTKILSAALAVTGANDSPAITATAVSEQTTVQSHLVFLPLVYRGGRAACCSSASGLAPRPSPYSGVLGVIVPLQYGKGHTLNFCLPICHNRASPAGSAIRKSMISAPMTMYWMCSTVAG